MNLGERQKRHTEKQTHLHTHVCVVFAKRDEERERESEREQKIERFFCSHIKRAVNPPKMCLPPRAALSAKDAKKPRSGLE